MSRPLTLAPLGFLELGPPALVRAAADAGFASVGVRVTPAVPGGIHYPLRPGSRELADTIAALEETGVRVLQVELVELSRATDVAAMQPMLETALALGATRVVATGDDEDAIVADRLAALATRAAELRLAVDLEFMPFRRVATLARALAIAAAAGSGNVAVMVDALHLARSGGTPADVAAADPQRLAVLQVCDAPAKPPPGLDLAREAREERLLPGDGELPLRDLVRAMPADTLLALEMPTRGGEQLSPGARARAGHAAMRALLGEGS